MSLVPETPVADDTFADSVKLASWLKSLGLPVSGARHDGWALAVGFSTPSGAEGDVSVPTDQADMIAPLRAAGQGKAGWL